MIFENGKVYDILKWFASPGCPAIATLLITVAEILRSNSVAQNVTMWFGIAGAIVAAIGTCLGEFTRISSKKYWDNKNSDSTDIEMEG